MKQLCAEQMDEGMCVLVMCVMPTPEPGLQHPPSNTTIVHKFSNLTKVISAIHS